MTTMDTQLGIKTETTWGAPVVVDRFYEFNSESLDTETGRVESAGLRSGQRVQRSDRFVPYIMGASGSIEMEVLSKNFGLIFQHCLGTAAISTVADSAYTQTFTVGSLLTLGLTVQVNRPMHPAGTDQAFTYEGMKVSKWGLSCDVEGLVMLSVDLVGETGLTATALASASYPASMEHLSWAGGVCEIADTAVPVTSFSMECDNGLDVGRHKQRANTLRQEPVEATQREITWSLTADFDSLAQHNRVKSATAAGALAKLEGIWTAPTLIGATTYPSLEVEIPAARFDEISDFQVSSTEPLMQSLSGRGLYNGTDSPVSLFYISTDSAA